MITKLFEHWFNAAFINKILLAYVTKPLSNTHAIRTHSSLSQARSRMAGRL